MAITAASLLAGIKDLGMIPSNRAQLTDTRFLVMADRIIETEIVPLLMSINSEFFVVYTTDTVVASQSVYSVPYRSINRGLRELKISDSSNNVRNVVLINMEDAHKFALYTDVYGFYFIGDKFRLVPDVPATLTSTLTLQEWFFCQPSSLCSLSDVGVVTGVTSTTVTVSSLPSGITTGTVVDFVQAKSGAGIYAMDKTVQNATGTTLTFTAGDIPRTAPYDLAVGDYVCVAGTSPVVNFVPNVCQSYLQTLTVQSILESIGDEVGAKALEPRLRREKEAVLKAVSPRIEGEPTIIINRDSLVRGRIARSRLRYYGA